MLLIVLVGDDCCFEELRLIHFLIPNQKGLQAAFGKDFKEIKTTKIAKREIYFNAHVA